MNRDRINSLGVCSEARKLRNELLRLLDAAGVDDTAELLFMLDKLRNKMPTLHAVISLLAEAARKDGK